jgi:Domain of unknown function (DUF3846)
MSSGFGLVIPAEGPVHKVPIVGDESYQLIRDNLDGGWLEGVRLPDYPDCLAFVDEEGRLKRLPLNVRASDLALQPIFGPMVIVGDDGSPDTVSLSSELLLHFLSFFPPT